MADNNLIPIKVEITGLEQLGRDAKKASSVVNNFASDLNKGLGIKGTAAGVALGTGIANGIGSAVGMIKNTIESGIGEGLNFLKNSLGKASDFQQVQIAFTSMLGSADKAKELLSSLQDFAQNTPFGLTELEDSGRQLLAYGDTVGEVTKDLDLLGNMSAGLNVPLNQLVLAFGQVKAKTRLAGQEMLQFTNAGVPVRDLLSKQLNVSIAEVDDLVSSGAVSFDTFRSALVRTVDTGGLFQDMMKKQMGSFNGLSSNLSDVFDKFMITIGGIDQTKEHFGELIKGGLLDTMQKGLTQLLKLLDDNKDKIAEMGSKLGQAFGTLVNEFLPKIIDKLPTILDGILKFAQEMPQHVVELKTTLEDLGKTMKTMKDVGGLALRLLAANFDTIRGVVVEIIGSMAILGLTIQAAYQQATGDVEGYNRTVAEVEGVMLEMNKNVGLTAESWGSVGDKIAETSGKTTHFADSMRSAKTEIDGLISGSNAFGQSMAYGFNQASAMQKAISSINFIKSQGGFSQGGMVPRAEEGIIAGQSMSGDKKMIRANSGEMIINRQDQNQLFNFIKSLSRPSMTVNATFNSGQRNDRQEMNNFSQILSGLI